MRGNKLSLAAALFLGAGLAGGAPAQPALASPLPAGWSEFADAIRDLPAKVLAPLPEAERNDPVVQQEAARIVLAAIASSAIDALGSDGDHPAFVPQVNAVLNVVQPNADTIYKIARVTPGGTYRLRGLRGSLRMAVIAEGGVLPAKDGKAPPDSGGPKPVHDINALPTDGEDRFDVVLSPVRPVGYQGEWWPLRPETDRLLLRMVSADWATERAPTLSIERLDAPVVRPRQSAAVLEQRLRGVPSVTGLLVNLYADHVPWLRAQGFLNKLRQMETSSLGLPNQIYYEGAYEVGDDEALIVEAPLPKQCLYHSIILTNDVYETTDWYNNHSSLNDAQAKPDADGVLRIVIANKDPGVPNWLDTAGYRQGSIQGRWAGCDSHPVPTVRRVAFTKLRANLPATTPVVTPEQRAQIVRERRAALQQRPLW